MEQEDLFLQLPPIEELAITRQLAPNYLEDDLNWQWTDFFLVQSSSPHNQTQSLPSLPTPTT